MDNNSRPCKYCPTLVQLCVEEGLICQKCCKSVHIKCLKRGVPGGLNGDVFFTFTCQECSPTNEEIYVRDKLSWLQTVVLVFYHLQTKSPGLARRGYFHWRFHVNSFIEKHWDVLIRPDQKRKKMLQGTLAGILSHFSNLFFLSGTEVFKEQAWWTLVYPKLTPSTVSYLYAILSVQKQKHKIGKTSVPSAELQALFQEILEENINDKSLLTKFVMPDTIIGSDVKVLSELPCASTSSGAGATGTGTGTGTGSNFCGRSNGRIITKRKTLLPTFDTPPKKFSKIKNELADSWMPMNDYKEFTSDSSTRSSSSSLCNGNNSYSYDAQRQETKSTKLFDPACHFNTSLSDIAKTKSMQLKVKLTGGVRHEMILSPYSGNYLKPYIWIDTVTFPPWLKLMAEVQLYVNNRKTYTLPARAPITFAHVQPEHIPAINSLCNLYFWPGIDLTDTLQYPEFSCVALYKRLVVGFAFLVPDVSHTENYMSFIFTRPMWRKSGIASFMTYHLTQVSLNKDITLHVAIDNDALFLYQKFGFKIERLEKGFYDKYVSDPRAPKNAYFLRLERSS